MCTGVPKGSLPGTSRSAEDAERFLVGDDLRGAEATPIVEGKRIVPETSG